MKNFLIINFIYLNLINFENDINYYYKLQNIKIKNCMTKKTYYTENNLINLCYLNKINLIYEYYKMRLISKFKKKLNKKNQLIIDYLDCLNFEIILDCINLLEINKKTYLKFNNFIFNKIKVKNENFMFLLKLNQIKFTELNNNIKENIKNLFLRK